MNIDIDNYEYDSLISDILDNREFMKIESCTHHKTSRLEHSKRVSFISYKICKKLKFDYISAARAGLLHDFFINKYSDEKGNKLIKNHPKIALANARKCFKLNKKEINIIESHMFPLNFKIFPKYKESYVVSIVDKFVCIYEEIKGYSGLLGFKLGKFAIYMALFVFNK
ncbi:MAG: HDIG domain-containing protein [Bacilli bacterium]|nr:HDIG domain-containing protein [Bacilli bacterium]